LVEYGFPRRLISGEDAGRALVGVLEALASRRILIVTDPHILMLPKTQKIINTLLDKGYKVEVYSDVPPEPPARVADEIAEEARRLGADSIVAIGGGSVIDAAKAGLVRYVRPDYDLKNIAPFARLGLEEAQAKLIAVPTTAGTGSDASYGIVVYDEEEGNKIPVGNLELIPYATILDPEYPAGAPRKIALGAAMDALGHAIEALTAPEATILTDALAEKVIATIMTRLDQALKGDMEAWQDIHLASTMAGIAFTNAGLGLIHAIAHPLGAKLGIHHGTIVGIVTPRVVRYIAERSPQAREKYERVVKLLEQVYGLDPKGSLDRHVVALQERVGFPTMLRDLGVSRERFEKALEFALDAAYRDPEIVFAPVIPPPEELKSLIEEMY